MKWAQATVEMRANSPLQWTWDVVTTIDPSRFYPKYRLIPATIAVREQTGPWNVVGQSRKLLLADNGWVVEHVTEISEPSVFIYELNDFQKLFKILVDHAVAEWRFREDGDGTMVTWTYRFLPRRRWSWAVRLLVRGM